MPTVPRRRVETAALPGVRVSPNAPAQAFESGSTLAALARPVGIAAEIVEEERQKADQIAVLDADNQLSELGTSLHGDALKMRGKEAMGARQHVREGWETSVSKIASGLTSERQKVAFQARAQSRWQSLNAAVERHTAQEAERYDTETTTAALQNRMNDAVTNYRDPARVTQAVAEQTAILKDFAKRNGLAPEVVAEKVGTAVSKTHTAVIDRILTAGDDRAASAYYAANKAAIQGDDQARIDKALEVGSTLGESQRRADQIMATRGVTRTQAFEAARQIDDPKLRQATEQRLDVEFSRRDRAERDAYETLQEQAYRYVASGAMPPASIFGHLKASDQVSIRSALRSAARGVDVETDWATYYDLKRQLADPKNRDTVDVLGKAGKLGQAELKELLREKADVKAGKASPTLRGFLTDDEMVSQAVATLKWKKEDPRYITLLRAVDDAIVEAKEASGKTVLPRDATQGIIDRLVLQHVYVNRPFGFDAEVPIGAVPTEERGRVYVPYGKIPDVERARIEAIGKSQHNRVPTKREVEEAYGAFLAGDRARFDAILGTGL
jgi:hypothetical protein